MFTFLFFFAVTSVKATVRSADPIRLNDPNALVNIYFLVVRVRVLAVLSDKKLRTYAHARL